MYRNVHYSHRIRRLYSHSLCGYGCQYGPHGRGFKYQYQIYNTRVHVFSARQPTAYAIAQYYAIVHPPVRVFVYYMGGSVNDD